MFLKNVKDIRYAFQNKKKRRFFNFFVEKIDFKSFPGALNCVFTNLNTSQNFFANMYHVLFILRFIVLRGSAIFQNVVRDILVCVSIWEFMATMKGS